MVASIQLGQMLANDSLKSLNSLDNELTQRMRRTAALKAIDGGAKANHTSSKKTSSKKTTTKKKK